MSCTLTKYGGILPSTVTGAAAVAACSSYMQFYKNSVDEMNALMPTLCRAANIANTAYYKGEFGVAGTPTSLMKGWSVSVGNDVYVSKIDNNTDTPPSVNFYKSTGSTVRRYTGNGAGVAIPTTNPSGGTSTIQTF